LTPRFAALYYQAAFPDDPWRCPSQRDHNRDWTFGSPV